MEQSPEAALFDARKWSIDRLNKAVTVGEKMRSIKNLKNGSKLNLMMKTLKFYI